MNRHLTAGDREIIKGIIYGWSAKKFTWDKLCEACEETLNDTVTRQTLSDHEDIKTAYDVRKEEIRRGPRKTPVKCRTVLEQKLLEDNERLDSEVATLKAINSEYALKFQRWATNAFQHGLSLAKLDQELPPVDRAASKISK